MKVTIVNNSQIDRKLFRLEAEFHTSSTLLNIDCFSGEEIIDFMQYGTSKELNDEGYGFLTLRLNEFESLFINKPRKFCNKIDDNVFNNLSLKKGDVLICRTNGNPKLVGKSAIVPKNYEYAFASYLFRVKPDYCKILPTTLAIYLNSKIGRSEIEKHLMVSNQTNFSPAKFREILIPKLGNKIQYLIDSCVWKSFKLHETSKNSYQQAQNLLLSELGLISWQPKHQLTFIKNYSDTQKADRIDAEYYQIEYDNIINVIKSYSGGWNTLGNLTVLKNTNFNPKSKKTYKYIELADIVENGEITDCMTAEGQNLPSRARRKVTTGDIIVSSIEGSLSSIAMIGNDYNKALCSTGFHIISSTAFNSETLLVLLKSIVGKLQLKKGCNGTILTAINKNEFNKIILPLIPEKKQAQIQQKVMESFELKKKSKYLLECAKQAVEMAIEKDEKKAINWLNNETRDHQNTS